MSRTVPCVEASCRKVGEPWKIGCIFEKLIFSQCSGADSKWVISNIFLLPQLFQHLFSQCRQFYRAYHTMQYHKILPCGCRLVGHLEKGQQWCMMASAGSRVVWRTRERESSSQFSSTLVINCSYLQSCLFKKC